MNKDASTAPKYCDHGFSKTDTNQEQKTDTASLSPLAAEKLKSLHEERLTSHTKNTVKEKLAITVRSFPCSHTSEDILTGCLQCSMQET